MAERFHRARVLAAALVAGSLILGPASSAQTTAESMHQVYGALAEILPLALDEGRLETPEALKRAEKALDVLERSAQALSVHAGESVSAEFTGLARSFESNVALLRQSLDMGRYHEFNYLALDLTHSCASCHERLPAGSGPTFAADLVKRVEKDLYTDLDRALLQIATRQFDGAMTTLEGIIDDPDTEPLDLELDGVLFDYLNVGITVRNDTGRVINTLERLTRRERVPYYMARYAASWAEQLKDLSSDLTAKPDLARARELFAKSLTLSPIPSSQERLVFDLVDASILRRLLEADDLGDAERAEVYWMLAVISIRTVNPRPGVPHTELLLDAAIRAAPGSTLARASYALLEEYNRVSFAGIPTAELPEPVLDLEALRKLAGVETGR